MPTEVHAHTVYSNLDYQYGDGWLEFQWSDDPVYVNEGLRIDIDGRCSRNMAIRSGPGPPDIVHFTAESLHLHFNEALAKRLELPQELVIRFNLDKDEHAKLSRAVAHFSGDAC